ncbi:Uma2 family endonuclease [Nocardiopsis sp. HNM0947]|uniref:Uma2 family endonuclease n=1 Tax=Nocardiopsis coralli TaxID=2772213 RepID=A0ABR9P9A3_9ACTN|nr:Uma2 family endonuclease [Nocardiopsis coralli]MBE3000414.1 Uma2 family endonuclease [Nocardiopsis coralli]
MDVTDHRDGAGALTVDDLARTPDDGRRYELVDGGLDVSPLQEAGHTIVRSRLTYLLGRSVPDTYDVLAGTGIILSPTAFRIPDVAVFDQGLPDEGYFTTPPLLAVEILSPESALRDGHTKRAEYAAFGIPAYWVINPHPGSTGIAEMRLVDGQYHDVTQIHGEGVFETEVPFPVRLVPQWLVASGPWRDHIGGPAGAD